MTTVEAPYKSSVQDLARRMKRGSGPLHDLTNLVAKTLHEERYPKHSWEHDREHDGWLAVGSWRVAEAVVRALPLAVSTRGSRR